MSPALKLARDDLQRVLGEQGELSQEADRIDDRMGAISRRLSELRDEVHQARRAVETAVLAETDDD